MGLGQLAAFLRWISTPDDTPPGVSDAKQQQQQRGGVGVVWGSGAGGGAEQQQQLAEPFVR
jgi:hypothetical protein